MKKEGKMEPQSNKIQKMGQEGRVRKTLTQNINKNSKDQKEAVIKPKRLLSKF